GRDPGWKGGAQFEALAEKQLKKEARRRLKTFVEELARSQELLWATDSHAVLVIFQALDAAGKDSTIKHVMTGVNPQGCEVSAFKQPSAEERDHNWLWRYARRAPERGRIGIFNRSYYEDVLVVRVHPEFLDIDAKPDEAFWQGRFD